jgi:hypothetical protein
MSKALLAALRILGLLITTEQGAHAAQMRSRAEGLPGVQASNTVGLGDIWVTGGLSSQFRIRPVLGERLADLVDSSYRDDFRALYGPGNKLQRDLRMVPVVGGTIGLANFLHLDLSSIPWDGEKLGASTARLKLTTPGNDNLRTFGLGVSLNATLSTEEDIYSRGETTPGFDPLLYFTVMADLDLVKSMERHPIKAYLNYSNLDDHTLARAYDQHQFVLALERKGARRSWHVRMAAALYKPLPTKFSPNPADAWLPAGFELGLGYRAAISDRITMAGELSLDPFHPIRFYDKEVGKPPRLQVEVSAPLFYTETQAEAIRSLIFNERERQRLRRLAARSPGSKPPARDSAGARAAGQLRLDDLSLEGRKAADSKDLFKGVFEEEGGEEDVGEKRKQIRSQLKQIEELLE